MPDGLPDTLEQARLQARFRPLYAFQLVFYPEDSGLSAEDVQAAITELKALIDAGGGGGGVWGAITGTLSAQTDLQAALDAKANVSSVPDVLEVQVFS
jgi:hypothetical protein